MGEKLPDMPDSRQQSSPEPPPKVLYTLKIAVVGESGTGKTALVTRFTRGSFDEKGCGGATIGVDFDTKTIQVEGETAEQPLQVKLLFWDTGGSEKFAPIARSYFREIAAGVIVCDLSRKSEMQEGVVKWLGEIKTQNPDEETMIVLCGNKADKAEEGAEALLHRLAENHNLPPPGVTSAKTGEGIESTFREMARVVVEKATEAAAHPNPLLRQLLPRKGIRVTPLYDDEEEGVEGNHDPVGFRVGSPSVAKCCR